MDYREAVAYLDAHIDQGVRPGLERISALLDLMAEPHSSYPIIQIAGSNGKTSVAGMATMLLVAHGLSAGTYISPHLEVVEERITLSGLETSTDVFAEAVSDVAPFVDLLESRTGDKPTYFELMTAVAYSWFAEKAVDVGVIEVGMGGRLDATSVAAPAVAVITSIALDHTKFLGESLSEIAAEKAAITGPDSRLVVGALPEAAIAVARGRAQELGIPIAELGRHFAVTDHTVGVGGWQIDIEGVLGSYEEIFLPVHGRHQTANFAVAVAAVEELLGRELDAEGVREAARAVTTPGRMEIVSRKPLVILEGAHNEEGFAALARTLDEEFPGVRWILVIGVMRDKELHMMIAQLAGKLDAAFTTSVESPRSLEPSEVAVVIREVLGAEVIVETADSPNEAIEAALSHVGDNVGLVVAGSLYVVGEARRRLRARL